MAQQLFHDLLVAISVFSMVVTGGLVLVWIGAHVEEAWRHMRRASRLDYERYRAEEEIRNIRREAICDLLEAERAHRYAYHDPNIIESTAVEVKR